MYSVCVVKHLLERGVIVIHILEEPLLGELWLGQGLCKGLDISLHEVVGFGLTTCEEVGVVQGVHLLSGEVRSVTTYPRRCQCSGEVVEETLLILQENQGDFLLELVAAVSRWVFSVPDPLQVV